MRTVLDVNVLRTANGEAVHANDACQLASVDCLVERMGARDVVVDDGYRIMQLYAQSCSYSGQPGVGDQFFLWLHQNVATLTKARFDVDAEGNFSTFPDADDLSTFDWDDRIYIATALGVDPPASLINAVDSDYSEHAIPLAEHGVRMVELCPDCLHRARGRA